MSQTLIVKLVFYQNKCTLVILAADISSVPNLL